MTLPTHPAMWAGIKRAMRNTSEGSRPGRWSARKAVIARLEYERRGGDFNKPQHIPPPLRKS